MADRRILPTNTGTESSRQSKHHWGSSSEPAQALNPQQDSLDDLEMKKKKKNYFCREIFVYLGAKLGLHWGKTGVTLGLHGLKGAVPQEQRLLCLAEGITFSLELNVNFICTNLGIHFYI